MKTLFNKPIMLSMVALAAVLTGCSAKHPNNSEVVVAPMAVPGGAYYNGNETVANSDTVIRNSAALDQKSVYFDFDSSAIGSTGANVLDQHISFLKQPANSTARVQISGNTDERGSTEYNSALGLRRAKAVQSYLANHGIPVSRTEAISYGEERPVDTGHDESAWRKNRRADLSYDGK